MSVVEKLQRTGARRIGSVRSGFRYRKADGSRLPRMEVRRVEGLAVPPAWTEVSVSCSATSLVQAVGRDRAGRWQYLYSERQARIREVRKRRQLLAFLRALPDLRARVAAHLRGTDLTRERVLAAMVRLLLRGFMRAGSHVYARDHGTFGLTTLRPRHVRVQGIRVTLSYRGKGKKFHVREIVDARAAAVVRQLLRATSAQVFRYRGADGEWTDVRRNHVNDYLQEITGARFTAKDFRTWAGTLLGACALARQGYPSPVSARSLRQRVNQAMRETSAILGNTPGVCRESYVCPDVIVAFEKGRILRRPPTLANLVRGSARLLSSTERRLSRLILNGHGARMAS
jgi:DNA topoisomerase I